MTRSTQISTYYLLLLFLFPIITFGQSPINQWNVWDFGGFNSNPITIDFNSGAPVVTNVGSCYGLEGNSGISDYNGNVLFYTNGETVWDASHNIMQNGTNLYGGNSSSQAAIIVPNPANNNIYYIFTTGDGDVNQPYPAYNRELRYSEVDMTLNGGLGAVTANKAIVLQADVGEKVSATRHANNSDVWVMTHSGVSNNFHAFLVTAAGVTMAPVNTAIGYSNNQSSAGFSDKGAIRFSYNGCKVLHISRSSNWIQLFDFDNQTGNVSNLIMTDNSISSPHSAEFSPDHTKLYVSYKGFFAVPSKESYQYDLTAANIPASKVQITNGIDLIGLQLGPDGKIYGSPRWSNTIHQIQSPNALGTACNFTANAISTVPSGGNHTTGTEFPQRVPGLESDFEWTGNCGEEYTFTVIDTFPVLMDAVSWDFGDPASGSANTSTDRIATHTFSGPGTHTVKLITYLCNWTDTTEYTFEGNIDVDLGMDTTLCLGQTITLDAQNPGYNYLWQDGSTASTFLVNSPGTYFVEVSDLNSTCTGYDTIVVDYITNPDLAGNDSIIQLCESDGIIDLETYLNGNNTTTGQWIDVNNLVLLTGSTINTTTTGSGTFNVSFAVGTSAQYPDTASFTIIIGLDNINIDLGIDTTLCLGETVTLDALNPGADFVWQDASTNSTFTVNTGGTYFVEVSNNSTICLGYDTIVVDYITAPDLAGSDSTIQLCELEGIVDLETYLNGNNTTTGQWTDVNNLGLLTGSTINTTTSGSGTFNISFITGLTTPCSDTANFTIVVGADDINVDLGIDTTLCLGETVTLDALNPGADFVWQDASTNSTFTAVTGGTYFVEVSNNSTTCLGHDTIVVDYITAPDLAGSDSTIQLCELEGVIDLETYLNGNNTTTGQWTDVNNLGLLTGSTINTTTSGSGTFNISFITGLTTPCSDTANFTIVVGADDINVDLGIDTTLCLGETVTLDALNPGADFVWQDASTNSTFTVNTGGTYFVEVSNNSTTCLGYDTIVVDYITAPDLAGNDSIINLCELEGIVDLETYLNGNNTTTGQWTDVNNLGLLTGSTINTTISGSGTFNISFITGLTTPCSDTANFTIVVAPDNVAVDLGVDQTLCLGETLVLDALNPGADFVWQDGSTNSTFTVNTGGTYFVGLSYNGIGCSGQDTIVIDYITAPDLAGSDSIIELCELEGIVDLETYLNGNNTTTGQWTDVNNLGLLTGSTINTTTSGSGTFNISFITGLTTPCSDTANFTIVVGADNVNVDLGTDVTLCLGETLVLDPLNPGADFVWQDGSTNSTFTVNTGGTYFVEVDNNTDICHGYDTIVVNYLTNPDLAGSDSTIEMCELSGMVNLEDYLSGNNTTTGQWLDVNNSGFLVGSNMNTMISGSGTFNMSFITGLASGCSDTANFIINMGNMPNAGLDGTVVICNDQGTLDLLTVLNGSPDSGGSWSPPLANGGNIFDPLINPEGIYTYEVNGDSWCPVDSSRATINVTNISSLEIISVPNACLDQLPFDLTATLTGGQWSGSGITNSQIGTFDANIAGVGIHTIDYSFNNGVCSKVVSTDILIGELPTVDLGDDLTICDNAQYQLTPTTTNADSVVWSTGFVGETLYIDAMFDKAGEVLLYDVLVENSCGVATDQINVTIKDCDIYVYVPNAFTPDGDNFNETFTPVLNGIDIYDYDLFIFNRWGEILFESHNPSIGWDGTYKGELLQDGVYIWKMKYADPYTDNRIEKNGTVTLLR